jgi:GTP-binding protein Era
MNRTVITVLDEADIVVFVVDCRHWTEEDELMLKRLQQQERPVILVLNKTDTIVNRDDLLPILKTMSERSTFAAVVPLSALKDRNIAPLEAELAKLLPEGQFIFASDDLTDCSDRFLASELIREKLMRMLGEEVPYSITVQIERFDVTGGLIRIAALIWVEKPGQKAIVIGKNGDMLKKVGQLAREEMEKLFEKKVFLHVWVKVKSGWSDDEHLLTQLGYRK